MNDRRSLWGARLGRRQVLTAAATSAGAMTLASATPAWASSIPAESPTGHQNLGLWRGRVPAPAAAAGFHDLVFFDDFETLHTIDVNGTGNAGYNWYTDQPFGSPQPSHPTYSIANSVVTVTDWWSLASMSPKSGKGTAFRYGYFEARIRFDPSLGPKAAGWPAFWMLSALHTQVNNLTAWAELDVFEAYTGGYSSYPGAFVGTLHDWSWNSKTQYVNYQNSNNYLIPPGVKWDQWHTVSCLWVQGKVTWYLDRVALMSQEFSPVEPPAPLANGPISPTPYGIFTILDTDPRGMEMIVGSSPGWPMDVDYVGVWQEPHSEGPGWSSWLNGQPEVHR
jgi:hypothetical protein